MKYKLIGLIGCIFIIFIATFNLKGIVADDIKRYHQHIDAPVKTPCEKKHDGELCTHLPLIIIDTDGKEIPGRAARDEDGMVLRDEEGHTIYTTAEDGADRISGEISVIDHKKTYNHPGDKAETESRISIHVRGNSSRAFDKAGYRIKLLKSNGENNPQELLGMDAHDEWALHGPFIDKTLMRNYMWYNITGEFMEYAPNVRFCEVIVNGKYQGVYVLTEVITAGREGKGRLNLEVNTKDNIFEGYLLRLDRLKNNEYMKLNSFTTYTLRNKMKLEIQYPGSSKLTKEICDSIKNDFSAFEKALYSYDYDDDQLGYKKYIDVLSFADYYIINEFVANYDAGWLSTYIYKDIDNRLKMCIWDFNSSCDNYAHSVVEPQHFELVDNIWYFMLTKDEDFINEVIERYRYLRETYLDEEFLLSYIDDVAEYLGPAIDRNYEIWGKVYSKEYDYLKPESRNQRSYEEAVSYMKNFIVERGRWLDDNIDALKQYSAESRVKKFNHNAN